jgi:hypothetical protein
MVTLRNCSLGCRLTTTNELLETAYAMKYWDLSGYKINISKSTVTNMAIA